MPILFFIVVIGAAAGFLATRIMKVQTDVPTTIVIGMLGAAVGWVGLRLLVTVTGFAATFVGAVIGAVLLIWAWRHYFKH